MRLTKVTGIAICGRWSKKDVSPSKRSSWWIGCPTSRSAAKDKEKRVMHPMSRAILKPKMMGPPWLCAWWLILRTNRFECVSSFAGTKVEQASSAMFRREILQKYKMACVISKLADANAVIRGMSRVFFHLSRRFSYSWIMIDWWLLRVEHTGSRIPHV